MAAKETAASGGLGLGTVLFLIFMTLKLCHVIDWSWWWVTAPLWGGLALLLVIIVGALILLGIAALWANKNPYSRL